MTGRPETVGADEAANEQNENCVIEKLLTALGVDKSKVVRRKRLRRKIQVEQEKNQSPPPILIEFTDRETQAAALKNARELKSNTEYSKVYVNRDKTEAERKEEARLRRERNERNTALPHTDGDMRYGVDDNTQKRFYWAVRGGRLVRLEPYQHRADDENRQ